MNGTKIFLCIVLVIGALLNAICIQHGKYPLTHLIIAILDIAGLAFVLLAPQWQKK